jgi:hypothetical protein
MERTELCPEEVRIPLKEPQLAHLIPRYELSTIREAKWNGSNDTWFREVRNDAGLFQEFAEKIETVEDGIVELESSGELTNSRVFGMLQHQLFDRLVRRVDPNQENNGLSQSEIRILNYLDVVLPISPEDEVVDNIYGDENPRPSWFDYVTQQASRVSEILQNEDEIVENLVVTPEQRVKAVRENRIARGREYLKNTAIIAGVGAIALVSGDVVSNATDIDAIGDTAELAAKLLGGWAGFRSLIWIAISQEASANEKAFARRMEFPLFNKAYVKFDDIRTEINYEGLQAHKGYWAKVVSKESKKTEKEKYDAEKQARSTVLDFLAEIEATSDNDDSFVYLAEQVEEFLEEEKRGNPSGLSEIYRLLDKYLPISEKDTVTPVNKLTGEKTWRGFFENYLTKNKQKH